MPRGYISARAAAGSSTTTRRSIWSTRCIPKFSGPHQRPSLEIRHHRCMKIFSRCRNRRGFSLIELLIVVAIILILAAIAAPKLNQNRMHAQETAAIRQIGTIHTAETQYYSQFGRYAVNLLELGPPSSGQ